MDSSCSLPWFLKHDGSDQIVFSYDQVSCLCVNGEEAEQQHRYLYFLLSFFFFHFCLNVSLLVSFLHLAPLVCIQVLRVCFRVTCNCERFKAAVVDRVRVQHLHPFGTAGKLFHFFNFRCRIIRTRGWEGFSMNGLRKWKDTLQYKPICVVGFLASRLWERVKNSDFMIIKFSCRGGVKAARSSKNPVFSFSVSDDSDGLHLHLPFPDN